MGFNSGFKGLIAALCINTYVHLRMVIPRLFLVRVKKFLDERRRENQNSHFVFNNFFRNSCCLCDKVEECGIARQDTDGDTAHAL